jgi:hypothetical protein
MTVAVMIAPVEFVQHQMSQNLAKPSFVSGLLGGPDGNVSEDVMNRIERTSTALYGGGSDTTVAVLSVFFKAMIMFPEVQRKAQEVSPFFFFSFFLFKKTSPPFAYLGL